MPAIEDIETSKLPKIKIRLFLMFKIDIRQYSIDVIVQYITHYNVKRLLQRLDFDRDDKTW